MLNKIKCKEEIEDIRKENETLCEKIKDLSIPYYRREIAKYTISYNCWKIRYLLDILARGGYL